MSKRREIIEESPSEARVANLVADLDGTSTTSGAIRLYCPCVAGLPARFAAVTGLLPIHDANGRLLEAVGAETRFAGEVYACVLAVDPFRRMEDILRELSAAGLAGVANFPTVTVIDGMMRATLDDLILGFEQEVRLIELARGLHFKTAGVVTSEAEARAMIAAGAGMLVVPETAPDKGAIRELALASRIAFSLLIADPTVL